MNRNILLVVIAAMLAITLAMKPKAHTQVEPIANLAQSAPTADVPVPAGAKIPAALPSAPQTNANQRMDTAPKANEEIKTLSQSVLADLPKIEEMKNLKGEEFHEVARPVFRGALELKQFADAFETASRKVQPGSAEEKSLASQGADFYRECAAGEDHPESLRAVCYVEFLKLVPKAGFENQVSQLKVPLKVVQLAQAIVK